MVSQALSDWLISCLVLGLRIALVFAFAPPFTLVRIPLLFRVLLGFGLSIGVLNAHSGNVLIQATNSGAVIAAAVRELGLGLIAVLALQIAFGALYVAGRTLDIQAGYGLAVLIDPGTQSQVPLIGTLFVYAAAVVFFGVDGHIALLRMLAASLDAIPLGGWTMPHSIERLTAFIGMTFLTAFGVAGGSILAMFLIDMAIALLSRTVPQMNVLVLGFQVKTIVLLLTLPAAFGIGGALFLRLMSMALQAIPRLM